MPPLNESDSYPYVFVLMSGSWKRLFILKAYGGTVLLKKYNRKEWFTKVIQLYTSSLNFCRFFHELSLPHLFVGAFKN